MGEVSTLDRVEYREEPHTGDLSLRVWADNPEHLYGSCLLALTRLLLRTETTIADTERHRLEASSGYREENLVALMQDYLYLAMTESFLASRAEVTEEEGGDRVTVDLYGERVDREKIDLQEIKAATYHQTSFTLIEGRRWSAFVVLDI